MVLAGGGWLRAREIGLITGIADLGLGRNARLIEQTLDPLPLPVLSFQRRFRSYTFFATELYREYERTIETPDGPVKVQRPLTEILIDAVKGLDRHAKQEIKGAA